MPGYIEEGKSYSNTVIVDKIDMADKQIKAEPGHIDDSETDEFDTMTLPETTAVTTAPPAAMQQAPVSSGVVAQSPAVSSDTKTTTSAQTAEPEQQPAFAPQENNNGGGGGAGGGNYVNDQPAYATDNQPTAAAENPPVTEPPSTAPATTAKTTTTPVTTTTRPTETDPPIIHVTGIRLITDFEDNNVQLDINNSTVISVEISPVNSSDKTVKWTSNRSDIAEVDDNGKVTAKSKGKAIITAKTTDGGLSASCMVTVK